MIINSPHVSIPNGFSFRKANNDDIVRIKEIIFDALREHDLEPQPLSTDSDLSNIEKAYKDGYFGLILHKDEIVSTFAVSPLDHKSCEIRKMYSVPSVRGKGLGKWMVQYLLQISRDNSFAEVELETASSLKAAIGLYKHLGFIEKDFENKTPRCDKAYFMQL